MNMIELLARLCLRKHTFRKSADAVRRMQRRKLVKLLRYAYDHSPYYRNAFTAAGIGRSDLRTVPLSACPVIDKAKLLDHFSDVVTVRDVSQESLRSFDERTDLTCRTYKKKYHVVHSSGSTGTPGYFLYDGRAWNTMLTGIIRAALWDLSMTQIVRLLAGGPRVLYIAATDGRYGGAMAVMDGIESVHAHRLFLDVKMPLSELVERINKFSPDILIGYPSALKILADAAEQKEISFNLVRVISCGEPLGESLRISLKQIFRTGIINLYGSSESLVLGVESENSGGMILFDDMNAVEVVDGTMYVTPLYNFAQPLIRYKLSDTLTLKPADGTCPFTKAVVVLGRSEDVLWFEDEPGSRDFLHPLAVEGFCIDGLRDYQFRQTGRSSFELIAEVPDLKRREPVVEELGVSIRRILDDKKLTYVHFTVTCTDHIVPDRATGKKKLILNGDFTA